ncbi:M23 family metallopeptidase [Streptomyces pseudogriseolus]|uniref:M23 family metallopeptidase n=1 Tax=Streptomyces pseudogriseolus TaxID=36817 RepID=UPI003FA2683A
MRLALVVALTVAALLAPPASRLFAVGVGAGLGEGAGAGDPASSPVGASGRRAADDAVPAIARTWPVGVRPRVLRGWEPPATVYGPGHRGVDLAAPPGTPVRAVADGRVSFAGRVAGKGVVSVELAGTGDPPLRTTYEPVRASVPRGTEVKAGEVIGTVEAGGSHCTAPCVHWGLLRGGAYLDPLSLLPPWLLQRGPSRLLPVLGVPLP